MAYIASPRLVFSGRFLSDVSTRNNSPDNYRPNVLQDDEWNPVGGSTFEFVDCSVSGHSGNSATDPVLACNVTGMADRPSGKMVDLDPAWQRSSEIWGFGVRVTDPLTGELGFQGKFAVASFRDLWLRQIAEVKNRQLPNGQPSGARFVAVLTDVEWGPLADRSVLLAELRSTTQENKLSVAIHQFGYFYTETHARHSTGSCIGAIGPYRPGDPETAIVARRLMPVFVRDLISNGTPGKLLDTIDFAVDRASRTVSLDLGHAMPIASVDGPIDDIRTVYPALASIVGLRFGLRPANGSGIFPAGAVKLIGGVLDVGGDWYRKSGGIVDLALSPSEATEIANTRCALFGELSNGSLFLLTEETEDGKCIRTDDFVRRMEPGDTTEVRIHARSFGEPAANVDIHLAPGGDSTTSILSFPNRVTTDAQGQAVVALTASDPGNPRGPLDGQIATIAYSTKVDANGDLDLAATGLANLDVIAVHVRDAFVAPQNVDFDRDIKPIMAQYDQLYPIMSAHLFKLADKEMFLRYRQALLTAFKRPIDHPNYMPVSRDLSRPKTRMIIAWLESQPLGGDPAKRDPGVVDAMLEAPDIDEFLVAMSTAEESEKLKAAKMFSVDEASILDVSELEKGGAI